MSKKIIPAILLLLLSLVLLFFTVFPRYSQHKPATNSQVSIEEDIQNIETTLDLDPIVVEAPSLPEISVASTLLSDDLALPISYKIPGVPFTSQAPHANWSMPYKEGCEEASALMIHSFYDELALDKNFVSTWILDTVTWQEDYFGSHKDLTAQETAEFISEYLHYDTVEVYENVELDDIKQIVSQGYPVIIPTAGRELHNPFFTAPGPYYHMLVIIGYTEEGFITHDPGTRRGENYIYDQDVLYNAIHDFNSGNILSGQKNIIIMHPE